MDMLHCIQKTPIGLIGGQNPQAFLFSRDQGDQVHEQGSGQQLIPRSFVFDFRNQLFKEVGNPAVLTNRDDPGLREVGAQ